MLGRLFKGRSELMTLQRQYAKLKQEAHRLSTVDRAQSDLKAAEAENVAQRIEFLAIN